MLVAYFFCSANGNRAQLSCPVKHPVKRNVLFYGNIMENKLRGEFYYSTVDYDLHLSVSVDGLNRYSSNICKFQPIKVITGRTITDNGSTIYSVEYIVVCGMPDASTKQRN